MRIEGSRLSLPLVAVCLDPVSVQIDKTSVQVASGTDVIFRVQTISDPSLITWTTAGGITLALWVNGQPVVISVPEYQGRISVTATQLKIGNSQLRDSGNYTVSVEPSPGTGLGIGTRSVQLKVFDAVNGVSLSLPGVPLEGRNVSLRCSWSAGTEAAVVWGKEGVALSSDTRITISNGSVVISPARRDDAGEYTCTVSNPVSARTTKANLRLQDFLMTRHDVRIIIISAVTSPDGPDAPQLTKTSSECVGGGDATMGQTFRLTCTSASLPPASFSWELNGQPVTAGQTSSGVLSLQIFSTNQSGRYVCTARNDITGVESKQQMDVVIVGICLSVGAVAGIVVACFVALIIIIIVIILLLRQRKVDKRIKDAVELQKTNQSNGHTVTAPPQNANITYRSPVNENVDPALHNLRTQNQQNLNTLPINVDGNIHTTTQNNPLQHNGHLSTDVFQHNGHLNTNSYPNNVHPNTRSFTGPGQHNPNILIQTSNPQHGAPVPTVHVNLNTAPNTDQHNRALPHTVHVNLNTYPPEASQQSHADQRESTRPPRHADGNQMISSQGLENPNASHRPSELIQTSYSHARNRGNANRRPDNSRSSTEEEPRRSIPEQMPWDLLQGTPAYPNRREDSSDSSEASERRPRSPRDAQRDRPAQVHRTTEHAVGSNQDGFATHGRDLQRSVARSVAPNHSRTDPNIHTQAQSQNQTAPRLQTHLPQATTVPFLTETHQTHPQTQTGARPDHTSVQHTQEALRLHTVQTNNPFTKPIQQTQAVVQNAGAPSQPTQQRNKSGQRAPTPPPVLQPAQFQTLPQERVQQTRNLQPAHVISQPFLAAHRHRSPDAHRRAQMWHTSPQRVPWIQPVHGQPPHVRQRRVTYSRRNLIHQNNSARQRFLHSAV
ncbi:HEPACAM family member 2 [Triplophysa tibetana]|uniref:HEPACAM family member 2 n=1 Tax=Triplophysa tibetana TaxID=1572043 RepID=A0A5A9N103_9TELE|nr:HEPACAM family member 2 [Triplophysa tibetana]